MLKKYTDLGRIIMAGCDRVSLCPHDKAGQRRWTGAVPGTADVRRTGAAGGSMHRDFAQTSVGRQGAADRLAVLAHGKLRPADQPGDLTTQEHAGGGAFLQPRVELDEPPVRVHGNGPWRSEPVGIVAEYERVQAQRLQTVLHLRATAVALPPFVILEDRVWLEEEAVLSPRPAVSELSEIRAQILHVVARVDVAGMREQP